MKSALFLFTLLTLSLGRASAAILAVSGSQTFQTIDGYGVNVNSLSWEGDELKPALDLFVDQLAATIYRVILDEMDWEETNDNADPDVFNWDHYNTIYGGAKFQKLWSTLRYLNTGNSPLTINGTLANLPSPAGTFESYHTNSTLKEKAFRSLNWATYMARLSAHVAAQRHRGNLLLALHLVERRERPPLRAPHRQHPLRRLFLRSMAEPGGPHRQRHPPLFHLRHRNGSHECRPHMQRGQQPDHQPYRATRR